MGLARLRIIPGIGKGGRGALAAGTVHRAASVFDGNGDHHQAH